MGKELEDFSVVSEKLRSKFPYLTLIEYFGSAKNARVDDSEYGEFSGIFINIFLGKKKHPERIAELNFRKAREKLRDKYNYLDLLDYKGSNNVALFLDCDFGQFSAIYNSVLRYGTCHSQRLFTDYQKRLKDKFDYLDLIEFNGYKEICKFKDLEFGEFTGKYCKVLNGDKRHPERSRRNKQIAASSNTVKNKRKLTCIEKYGCETPLLNKDIKEKIEKTNIERYGFSQSIQSKVVQDKINATKIRNGFALDCGGTTASDLFTQAKLDFSYTKFLRLIHASSWEEALNYESSKTDIEFIIETILKKNGLEYVFNKKLDGCSYRPDFRIDNLIIEADGLKHHSDLILKNKKYHLQKMQTYHSLGYQTLFFRGDEIIFKPNIVESIIKARLQKINNAIYARNCTLVKGLLLNDWFNENHLMGNGCGCTYALLNNNLIVAAMSIVKKQSHIEISRFCNKIDTIVIGGFSKILKHIIKDIDPKEIVSFVDLRYGTGNSLIKQDFVGISNNLSFKWTDFNKTYHRMKFRGNSGYTLNLFKIWDCGQKKFSLKLKDFT